jgi:hypothetical protein
MNWRRFALSAAAVFIAQAAVAGVLQAGVVDRLYDDPSLFRAEGDEKLLPYFASRILFVLLFTYVFARGFAGHGRWGGLLVGLLYRPRPALGTRAA